MKKNKLYSANEKFLNRVLPFKMKLKFFFHPKTKHRIINCMCNFDTGLFFENKVFPPEYEPREFTPSECFVLEDFMLKVCPMPVYTVDVDEV